MSEGRRQKIDPITLEVIKNRIKCIADEMFLIVKKTAASPLYTESNDYSLGLFDGNRKFIQLGGTAVFHFVSLKSIVDEAVNLLGEDPGIDEGDMIMANDAYGAGGIHSLDLGIVSPVFYKGKVVAWTGSVAQQMDIGGMTPGGFNLEAVECYQEGLRFPPMKLYEKGKLRKDLWNFYLANIRLPEKQAIDMKGQVSANKVAGQRVQELCDEFGPETFQEACDVLLDLTETELRSRIRALPDGVYESVDYEEHDGRSHRFLKVQCGLTVQGDELKFDFSGTCPQLPGPVNLTKVGLSAMIYAGLIPSLGWGIPWNDGVTRPVTVTAPEGCVVNACVPAPVSMPFTGFRALEAAMRCINKALEHSDFHERANAAWQGMWPIIVGYGLDQYGNPALIPWMDGGIGGQGAFPGRDGVDNSGMIMAMNVHVCDVEWSETYYPFLFLERKVRRDSEGAGEYRGGAGVEIAAMAYDTPRLDFVNLNTRKYLAGYTLAGGYPGGQHLQLLKHGTNVSERMKTDLPSWEDLPQPAEEVGTKSRFSLLPGDVFYYTGGGGSGVGDPIDREPSKVSEDVRWEYVSLEKAYDVYGVALDPDTLEVDLEQTRARRDEIRRERLASDSGEPG
ncbi:MAG: hydantoinase B/oxoprolinase family protein [Deltaproteobacteria bacterium]|nr:hydantoinase B/oxoprolinase family protein [Deltaproteobacteria bacterium]